MSKVFLSYSQTDRFFAEFIVRELRVLGVDVFYDRLIHPGAPWTVSMDRALESSDFVLVSLSKSYLSSPQCQRQLNLSLLHESEGGALVVPLLIEECSPPDLIRHKAYADFTQDVEIGLDSLIFVLLGASAGVNEEILAGYRRQPISTARLAKLTQELHLASERSLSPPRVFLCHAVEDKARVDQVYFALGASGIDPWYDKAKLLTGDRWEEEILRAIEQTDFFAIFLSKISIIKRGFIQKEIRMAAQEFQKRPDGTSYFLPIRLDSCEIPRIRIDANTVLSDFQWIDLQARHPAAIWNLAKAIWSQWAKRSQNA